MDKSIENKINETDKFEKVATTILENGMPTYIITSNSKTDVYKLYQVDCHFLGEGSNPIELEKTYLGKKDVKEKETKEVKKKKGK